MALYAHVVNGVVEKVVVANAAFIATQPNPENYYEVTTAPALGATRNPDGTYTNPPGYPSMTLADARATRLAAVKVEARERILNAAPDWKQRNAALGFYDATETQNIKDAINNIRTASNTAESNVNALGTVDDVLNFTW